MAEPNWKNRTLFHGDNLGFLQSMTSESVDLIATDPPFNKGIDFHADPGSDLSGAKFQDRWSWIEDVHPQFQKELQESHYNVWLAIESARKNHSNDMGAFCSFLAARLLQMHRILKTTGSIYVHMDQTASGYVRVLMDAIFGSRNLINEIVWQRHPGAKMTKNKYCVQTDMIFLYAKNIQCSYFLPQMKEHSGKYLTAHYRHDDGDGKGLYRANPLNAPSNTGGYHYDYKGYAPPSRGWRCPEKTMQRYEEEGLLIFPKTKSGRIQKKIYLDDSQGVAVGSLWSDIGMLQGNDKEKTGYGTQKPVKLYARMIEASCPEGGIVLDPFAGCATTLVAAEKLRRQWVGMDLWDGSYDETCKRMKDECWNIIDAPLGSKEVHFSNNAPEPIAGLTGKNLPSFDLALVTKKEQEEARSRNSKKDDRRIKKQLIEELGLQCQGCFDKFRTHRYLELDHRDPHGDGGSNREENRDLLCRPCNSKKRDDMTRSGLWRYNVRNCLMTLNAPDEVFRRCRTTKEKYEVKLEKKKNGDLQF